MTDQNQRSQNLLSFPSFCIHVPQNMISKSKNKTLLQSLWVAIPVVAATAATVAVPAAVTVPVAAAAAGGGLGGWYLRWRR